MNWHDYLESRSQEFAVQYISGRLGCQRLMTRHDSGLHSSGTSGPELVELEQESRNRLRPTGTLFGSFSLHGLPTRRRQCSSK